MVFQLGGGPGPPGLPLATPMTTVLELMQFTELGTRYLKSSAAFAATIWQKLSLLYFLYLNKKVAPLPLLAYKMVAPAATSKKIDSKKNDGL